MLAVQIVNYRTRAYLERCLLTVAADLRSSGVEYEINLLENASGDALGDLAARYERCRAYSSERNLGFGAGHNVLAGHTDAAYLLILNPDVQFLSAGTAQRLLAVVTGEESVRVVGPKLIGAAGEPQSYDHGRLSGLRAQIALRGGHSYWRPSDVAEDVAWVSGAAMLVDHPTFAGVGGFDQNLFLYKEDEDFCLRIRRAGGRVRYEPSVVVRHEGSVVAERQAEMAVALNYYFHKHSLTRRSHRLLRTTHQWLAYLRL